MKRAAGQEMRRGAEWLVRVLAIAALSWTALGRQVAEARDLVIYDSGSEEEAVKLVARAAGVSPTLLRAYSWSEVLGGPSVVLVGAGTVELCDDPVSTDTVRTELEAAEADALYLKYAEALVRLDDAVEALRCADTPLDAALAARLHLLRGVALHALGQEEDAADAFRRAATFQPGVSWDEDLGTDARPLFDAAVSQVLEDPGAEVELLQHPGEGMLWLDGDAIRANQLRLRLTDGPHIVQFGDPVVSATIELKSNATAQLVLGSIDSEEGLAWVEEEASRREPSTLLAAELGEDRRVYIVHDGVAWRGITGETVFAPFRGGFGPMGSAGFQLSEVGEDGEIEQGTEAQPGAWGMAALGGAVAITGGVVGVLQNAAAQQAAADAQAASDQASYLEADQRRSAARTGTWVGVGVGVIGLGMFGTGLAAAVDASPMWLPGGGGLRVTLSH